MRRHWEYLKYVLRHKWFVLIAGLNLGVPVWQLIIHDWDKFLPDEWIPYAQCFYSLDGHSQYAESNAFTIAWLKHQNRNPHHWQYWMITWDRGDTECIAMPERFWREMLADWHGAGRALGKADTAAWYATNYDKIQLHERTRKQIDIALGMDFSSHELEVAEFAADVEGASSIRLAALQLRRAKEVAA